IFTSPSPSRVLLYSCILLPYPHSFPTRRSSDLRSTTNDDNARLFGCFHITFPSLYRYHGVLYGLCSLPIIASQSVQPMLQIGADHLYSQWRRQAVTFPRVCIAGASIALNRLLFH